MKTPTFLIFFCLIPIIGFGQTYQWAVAQHTPDTANQFKIVKQSVDAQGNILIVGNFSGSIDADPGPGVFTLTAIPNGNAIFVQKLDTAGNFIWAISVSSPQFIYAKSITLDSLQNIYIMGYYQDFPNGNVDFDPGPAVVNIPSQGNTDGYLLKLNQNGTYLWAKTWMSNILFFELTTMTIHKNSITLCGYTSMQTDLDPGPGIFLVPGNGFKQFFIFRLNLNGDFLWGHSVFGDEENWSTDVAVDSSNNIIVVGSYFGSIGFIPGVPYSTHWSPSPRGFVYKINDLGAYVWVKFFQSMANYDVHMSSVVIDSFNNIYVSGNSLGIMDVDPGPAFQWLQSNGGIDPFICKLNSNGELIWGRRFGGTKDDYVKQLILKGSLLYACGNIDSAADIDPSPLIINNYISAGKEDIFVLKLDLNGNLIQPHTIGGIGSDTFSHASISQHGQFIYSGRFSDTVDMDFGPATAPISENPTTHNTFVSKWSLCIPTIPTFSNVIACGFYQFGGNMYYNDTTLNVYYTSSTMCDSIHYLQIHIPKPDTSITQSGNTFTANALAPASYQWTLCPSYTPIPGATSQNYTATANASYALIVTLKGCSDTSNCYPVNGLSLSPINKNKSFTISPNPSNGNFSIQFSEEVLYAKVSIINFLGQILHSETEENISNLSFQLHPLPIGIYTIHVDLGDIHFVDKIFIQD